MAGNTAGYGFVQSNLGASFVNGLAQTNIGVAGVVQVTFTADVMTRKNANSTTMTAQPRHFVQAGDPGAAAADNDLWIW